MIKGRKLDLIVFLVLVMSIAFISTILVFQREEFSAGKVAPIAILYNAGLASDYKALMASPSYVYDDRVLSIYNYFTGKTTTRPVLSTAIRMHNVADEVIFSETPSIDKFIPLRLPKEFPNFKSELLNLVNSNSLLAQRGSAFQRKLGEEIYRALLEFSGMKIEVTIGGRARVLDLSKVDIRLVASIMVVESSLNPFALMEERSLDTTFSTHIYSRGLMQIYEMTLWMLNSWLGSSQINIKPDGLWSVRNNIFLGMVYLAYANELLEE
jgi:hypothetical protein